MPPSAAGAARPASTGFIVILGALMAFAPLSIDMYLPAFPAIEAHFAASAGAVQATLAVFLLGLAVGQTVYGPLADRLGRRRPLLAGIALYGTASVAAVYAPDVLALTAVRLVQALGGCAGMVITRAVVADRFDERESAKVYSALMLVMGLAPILAPMIGAALLAHFDWRAIFWTLAAFGGACFVAVAAGLEETLPPGRRSAGGVASALRAFLRLLSDRSFLAFGAAGGLVMAGMFTYIAGSPFVFIQLHGVSPQQYGLLFGANAFGIAAASQLNARLLRRFPGRRLLAAGILANAAAGAALAVAAATGAGGLLGLAVPLFVAVSSLGLVLANATAAAMARAGGNRGAASALIGVMQFGFGAAAGALLGAVQDGTARPMALIIAALGVAALLVSRFARAD